jgi:hypothetical protein
LGSVFHESKPWGRSTFAAAERYRDSLELDGE